MLALISELHDKEEMPSLAVVEVKAGQEHPQGGVPSMVREVEAGEVATLLVLAGFGVHTPVAEEVAVVAGEHHQLMVVLVLTMTSVAGMEEGVLVAPLQGATPVVLGVMVVTQGVVGAVVEVDSLVVVEQAVLELGVK